VRARYSSMMQKCKEAIAQAEEIVYNQKEYALPREFLQ